MHPLYQRLKELDPNTFEKLIFHLIQERHPGIEVKHVEGAAGDEGIDSFSGDLDDGPVIWQAKSFPNGVGKSQKEQIRKSLQEALRHSKPRRWILCLSVDLDTKSHRWFQKFGESHATRVEVGLLDAGQIVHELIHRRSLREAFFPQAILDTLELRQVLAKTGELTTDELAEVTAENLEQYLERLKARDARFTYQVIFSGNGRPTAPDVLPGLLASVSDGNKTIQVFARDVEALRLNPVKATFTLKGGGVDKFQEFIRTGKSQDFAGGELLTFSSDLSFLLPSEEEQEPGGLRLHITPSAAAERVRLPLRVTFGGGGKPVVYEWIPFEVARAGTEEMELVSTGDLPFRMSIVFGSPDLSHGRVGFTYSFAGSEMAAIKKFMDAIDVLRADRTLELYNLERGSRLCRAEMKSEALEDWDKGFQKVVEHALAVSDHYGVQLRYRKLEVADLPALAHLYALIDGLSLSATDLTLNLVKVSEPTNGTYDSMKNTAAYRLVVPRLEPVPVLFGVAVPTGRVVWDMPEATVEEPEATFQRISRASVGDRFQVKLKLLVPVQIRAGGCRNEQVGRHRNSQGSTGTASK